MILSLIFKYIAIFFILNNKTNFGFKFNLISFSILIFNLNSLKLKNLIKKKKYRNKKYYFF